MSRAQILCLVAVSLHTKVRSGEPLMKQQYKSLRWSAAVMFATALLSGCSTVSNVASSSVSALSSLNPFSGDKEVSTASDAAPTPAPAAPKAAIRVEAPQQEPVTLAAMPAPAAVAVPEPAPAPVKKHRVKRKKAPVSAPVVAAAPATPAVQATVAGNTQCTTFCALPMHKPSAQ